MADLFTKAGLYDDTGLLRERWQQEGSTLISAYVSSSADPVTMLTVTSGKKFYLKKLTILNASAGHNYSLEDNGTVKNVYVYSATGWNEEFNTPLEFLTNVQFDRVAGAGASADFFIIGWEEPL